MLTNSKRPGIASGESRTIIPWPRYREGHMDLTFGLTAVAASLCVALALIAPFRSRQKAASWFFAAGMLIFAAESVLQAISLEAGSPERIDYWQSLALVAASLLPGVWFCFSVTYSRGEYRAFFRKWRLLCLVRLPLPCHVGHLVSHGVGSYPALQRN